MNCLHCKHSEQREYPPHYYNKTYCLKARMVVGSLMSKAPKECFEPEDTTSSVMVINDELKINRKEVPPQKRQ